MESTLKYIYSAVERELRFQFHSTAPDSGRQRWICLIKILTQTWSHFEIVLSFIIMNFKDKYSCPVHCTLRGCHLSESFILPEDTISEFSNQFVSLASLFQQIFNCEKQLKKFIQSLYSIYFLLFYNI